MNDKLLVSVAKSIEERYQDDVAQPLKCRVKSVHQVMGVRKNPPHHQALYQLGRDACCLGDVVIGRRDRQWQLSRFPESESRVSARTKPHLTAAVILRTPRSKCKMYGPPRCPAGPAIMGPNPLRISRSKIGSLFINICNAQASPLQWLLTFPPIPPISDFTFFTAPIEHSRIAPTIVASHDGRYFVLLNAH